MVFMFAKVILLNVTEVIHSVMHTFFTRVRMNPNPDQLTLPLCYNNGYYYMNNCELMVN